MIDEKALEEINELRPKLIELKEARTFLEDIYEEGVILEIRHTHKVTRFGLNIEVPEILPILESNINKIEGRLISLGFQPSPLDLKGEKK